MGDIKLYQSTGGSIWDDKFHHVFYRSIVNSLDVVNDRVIKMAEYKLAFFVLTLFGIPAYIYAWFLDVQSTFDLWKGIILTAIGAFTGIVIGARQFIKFLHEWKEYKKKWK